MLHLASCLLIAHLSASHFRTAPLAAPQAEAAQAEAAQAPSPAPDPGLLDLSALPASTRWVAHVDVVTLRRSAVGAYLLADERRGEKGWSGLLETLRDLEGELGFDVRKEIHAATLYGGALGREASAVCVVGTEVFRDAAQRVTKRASYRAMELEGALVHTFVEVEADGTRREVLMHLRESAPGRFTAILTGTPVLLSQALRVRGGAEPSLAAAAAEREWLAAPSAGAFFYTASAVGLGALGELDPESKVGEMVQRFQGEVGEADGQLYARLFLDTAKARQAEQLSGVLLGLRALLSLGSGSSEENARGADLLDWLKIAASGSRVTLELVRNVQDVLSSLAHEPR